MNDDSNWLARAGIEHRVAAMYEEALRYCASIAEQEGAGRAASSPYKAIEAAARTALANAVDVGKRAVVEFEASREQMIKLRRDTIEECAQHLEQRLARDNATGASSAREIAGIVRALVPGAETSQITRPTLTDLEDLPYEPECSVQHLDNWSAVDRRETLSLPAWIAEDAKEWAVITDCEGDFVALVANDKADLICKVLNEAGQAR